MKSLYQKRTDQKFYDKWESTPPDLREALQREKLLNYIRVASQLPFYQKRFSKLQESGTYPLKEVPVLNSSDLRDLLPPTASSLILDKTQNYTVFQSGGTTGIPKTTLFSSAELDGLDLPNARGFFAVGLTEKDRVANLFAVGALYMTFVHINRMLQQYGCQNFPFANNTPVEFVYQVSKLFQVNCFTGIASIVINALRQMKELGDIKIEKIYYGGEHVYEADKRELKENFGTKIVLAPGYGTVDTWYLGYQCQESATGVFHAHDDQVYLEIVNEETGEHCEIDKPGMLYATAFERLLTPIVRYRVGDKAVWLKDKCPCGRTTPLYKLLGRGDDVLRIGYDSIDYQAIQDSVLKVPSLSGSIQMEKKRREGKDLIIIRVETAAPNSEYIKLKIELEKVLLASRPTLSTMINTGRIWPLEIEILKENQILRNPRTGKMIRVVDSHGE